MYVHSCMQVDSICLRGTKSPTMGIPTLVDRPISQYPMPSTLVVSGTPEGHMNEMKKQRVAGEGGGRKYSPFPNLSGQS